MGLLKFTPVAWKAVETLLGALDPATCDRLDMTGLLNRLLQEKSVPIAAVATDGHWGEMDNPGDAALYENMMAAGELRLDN